MEPPYTFTPYQRPRQTPAIKPDSPSSICLSNNFEEIMMHGAFLNVLPQWARWETWISLKRISYQFLPFMKLGKNLTTLTKTSKPRKEIKRPENIFLLKKKVCTLFFFAWIITSWTFRSDRTATHPPRHLANLAILSSNDFKAWGSTETFHASDLFKNIYKALLTSRNRNNIVSAIKPWNGKNHRYITHFQISHLK